MSPNKTMKQAGWRWIIPAAACALCACSSAAAPKPVFVHYDVARDKPTDPGELVAVGIAVERLDQDKDLHAVVIGHADAQGSEEANRKLSLRRARNVRTMILDHKIPAQRVEIGARGESKPVASNETAEGRAKNRRVEIFFYYPSEGDAKTQYRASAGVSLELHAE